MPAEANSPGALGALFLARSRALLRTRVGVLMVAFVATVYTVVSLLVGQMLVVAPTEYTSVQTTVLYGQGATAWWNYPALVVTAPGGTLVLPFLATVTMAIVAVGVGIGMSVGLVLAWRLLRQRGRAGTGTASVGSLTGLTPAMIALVTLGACCSTTAAATAGIGAIAQASGVSIVSVLANTWYLDAFQVAVLWVALVAQEQLLAVYGRLVLVTDRPVVEAVPAPVDGRFVAGAVLRVALVIGGVTWGLGALAEWTAPTAPGWTSALIVGLVGQHLLPASFAVGAGLLPLPTYRALRGGASAVASGLLRAALLVAGASLLAWLPPAAAGAGVFGLGNEIVGALGGSAAAGGVVPPAVGPVALAVRWGLQLALLGAVAIAASVAPERAFLPLQWTTGPRPTAQTRVESDRGTRPATDPSRAPFPAEAAPRAVETRGPS